MNRKRKNVDASASLLLHALAANRAYAEELERSIEQLSQEESAIQTSISLLRQRSAMRRTERAMTALGWGTSNSNGSSPQDAEFADENSTADVFAKEVESRYKRVGGVVPRSYIRQRPSFFCSPQEKPTIEERAAVRKKQRSKSKSRATTTGQEEGEEEYSSSIDLACETEPVPNADTLFLRQHSHEAFLATPAKGFTPKERELVRKFALDQVSSSNGDLTQEIPLETWNQISHVTHKPPIHRSGFACKLRWELHDNPTLRLCAWTKDEDRALKELATGVAEPAIVNDWKKIASRMPLPGRPPVHCLIRYMTKLCPSNLNEKFTQEEDELLTKAVHVFGERWTIIADLMDGRIAEQLRHRWQGSLSPNVKLGKFSIIEDRRLLLALYAYYDRDGGEPFDRDAVQWQHICHHIPGRPPPPLRDRFFNSLNPEVTFREWTKEEDYLIRSTVQARGFDGTGIWPRLAAELGNRTDNQVARRARVLLSDTFKQHQEMKKLQDQRTSLPTIFQRTAAGRRDGNDQVPQRRSSYNGQEESDLSAHESSLDESHHVLL